MAEKKSSKKFRWLINLHKAWFDAGEPTAYAIRRDTGIAWETAKRYLVPGGVEFNDVPNTVAVLLDYFMGGKVPDDINPYVKILVAESKDDPTPKAQIPLLSA